MKRKLLAALAALAVALEALPWSAALTLTEKGETKRAYCSSFDPTPFIDRNFGPLLTAVASCLLLLTALVYLAARKGLKLLQVLAGASFVFSLLPLLHAGEHFTVLGGAVSLILLAEVVLSFSPLPDGGQKKRKNGKKKRKRS